MNDRDKLLAEALHADWQRAGSAAAARAARSVRRRRRARAAAALGIVTLAVGLAFWRATEPATSIVAIQETPSASPKPALEIISDEELLELLRGESVLAIRDAHGVREIVWLEPGESDAPVN